MNRSQNVLAMVAHGQNTETEAPPKPLDRRSRKGWVHFDAERLHDRVHEGTQAGKSSRCWSGTRPQRRLEGRLGLSPGRVRSYDRQEELNGESGILTP